MEDDLFTIKLDLKMMSSEIRGHLLQRSKDIQNIVDSSIKEYCEGGKLELSIKLEVEKILQDSVKHYFRVGSGKSLIDNSISEELDRILHIVK